MYLSCVCSVRQPSSGSAYSSSTPCVPQLRVFRPPASSGSAYGASAHDHRRSAATTRQRKTTTTDDVRPGSHHHGNATRDIRFGVLLSTHSRRGAPTRHLGVELRELAVGDDARVQELDLEDERRLARDLPRDPRVAVAAPYPARPGFPRASERIGRRRIPASPHGFIVERTADKGRCLITTQAPARLFLYRPPQPQTCRAARPPASTGYITRAGYLQ